MARSQYYYEHRNAEVENAISFLEKRGLCLDLMGKYIQTLIAGYRRLWEKERVNAIKESKLKNCTSCIHRSPKFSICSGCDKDYSLYVKDAGI